MEILTKQSITDEEFLYLLGVCQWVFNSNCSFIIEMIDKEHHNNSNESWAKLIEMTAGRLKDYKLYIETILGKQIYNMFSELVDERNCIIHSFPTGEKVDDYYIPVYRNDSKKIYVKVDKEYLIKFIKKNEELSTTLHKFRTY